MMSKKLYIETVGCQMNMLDSEMVVASLRKEGYELIDDPKSADTILFNTCSVREHAEEKIYSALGRLRQHKKNNPDKVIGVMGCMAQKDQESIFDRAPFVDIVVGPGQLQQIPDLIRQAETKSNTEEKFTALSLGRTDGSLDQIKRSHETFDPLRDPTMRPTPFQAYLRIQIGCDKFCTYCIVPMTRGPEQGRCPEEVVQEAKILADQGCKEITLVGQTVNSYLHRSGEKETRLADLLRSLHEIDGIERLKFITNYPKDMSDDLLETVRDYPKCSTYLHVPLQHGCDDVLKRMKRGYTVADYQNMMERIWDKIPGASVSSDFIVGFCGETDEEHQRSADALRKYRFKNSFIFKYSERPTTKAERLMIDDIPDEVKKARNQELLAIQAEISEEDNQKFLGREVEVLVEGPSKMAAKKTPEAEVLQLTGRTMCDRIVVFEGNRRQVGQMLKISVHDITPFTLIGNVVTDHHVGSLVQLSS